MAISHEILLLLALGIAALDSAITSPSRNTYLLSTLPVMGLFRHLTKPTVNICKVCSQTVMTLTK